MVVASIPEKLINTTQPGIVDNLQMWSEDLLNTLKRIGLNQYESRTYLALLSLGSSTAGELSDLANVPRSRVYDVLASLERKGFAIVQLGRPVKYIAVPPRDAFEKIRKRYEKEFEEKIENISKLEREIIDKLESIQQRQPFDLNDITGVLRGKINIYYHMERLLESAESRILKVLTTREISRISKYHTRALKDAYKRGVETKIAVPITPEIYPYIRDLSKYSEIRHIDFDARFLVVDGREVVLMTAPDTETHRDMGLWVRSSYLARTFEKIFEHIWSRSKPVEEALRISFSSEE